MKRSRQGDVGQCQGCIMDQAPPANLDTGCGPNDGGIGIGVWPLVLGALKQPFDGHGAISGLHGYGGLYKGYPSDCDYL